MNVIQRRKKRTANIGIFAVGHDEYWGQFPGLKEELSGYVDEFERQSHAEQDVSEIRGLFCVMRL